MNRYIIVLLIFITNISIHSEVFLMKDGTNYLGNIIKRNEDTTFIMSKDQEFSLDNRDIRQIFLTEDIYNQYLSEQKELHKLRVIHNNIKTLLTDKNSEEIIEKEGNDFYNTGGVGKPDDDIVDIRKQRVVHPETFTLAKPFRQELKDGKMIRLDIALGIKPNNKRLQMELTEKITQIRDITIKTLSKLDSDYFKDENSLDKFQEDLIEQLNRILSDGKVEQLFFREVHLY